jgi:hypothetical protein
MMEKVVKGIVKFHDIGMGCWGLIAKDGEQFELIGGDDSLYKDGKKVKLKGRIRDDLMSTGNIGPILEVISEEKKK